MITDSEKTLFNLRVDITSVRHICQLKAMMKKFFSYRKAKLQKMSADMRNLDLGNGSIMEDLSSYRMKKPIHGLKKHISQYI